MSLYPGNTRLVEGQYRLDDTGLAESMAQAMDDELRTLYAQLKGTALPDQGRSERQLLFVAIARGVLRYLRDHQEAVETEEAGAGAAAHQHLVTFDITMDRHDTH